MCVLRSLGGDVDIWIQSLEGFSRQLLGVLPAEKSLAAITTCAVLYGTLCWGMSRTLLVAAGLSRDIVQRAFRRGTGRAVG